MHVLLLVWCRPAGDAERFIYNYKSFVETCLSPQQNGNTNIMSSLLIDDQ